MHLRVACLLAPRHLSESAIHHQSEETAGTFGIFGDLLCGERSLDLSRLSQGFRPC
jgi:hypothetical protein